MTEESFLIALRRLLTPAGRLTPERVCQIIAEHFGGERIYVPKRPPIDHHVEQSNTPKELADRAGVARSTAYRLLRVRKTNWVNKWK